MAEVFDDGIVPDVVVFPIGFRIVAQAVIEKIALPVDYVVFGVESLPVADDAGHRCISREGEDGVQVVGHEEEQGGVPAVVLVVVDDSVE